MAILPVFKGLIIFSKPINKHKTITSKQNQKILPKQHLFTI